MAFAIPLGKLVAACQTRAIREGDQQLDPLQWRLLVWEYYGFLHALVAEKGTRYFESEASIVATGASTYALPADLLSVIGVDLLAASGLRVPIRGPIPAQWRPLLLSQQGSGLANARQNYFGIEGNAIAFYPAGATGTYKLLYIPQPVDFTQEDDDFSVDLINNHGFRFVLWGVASVAQHSGSENQDRAITEHAKARDELEYWACHRALLQPSYAVNDEDLFRFGGSRWAGGI